jgi:hypothetical protein
MNKGSFKFSIIGAICLSLLLLFSSCQKSNQSESYDILNFSDETTAAAEQVADANEDLNKIKVIYKRNESKRDELKEAMKQNDAENVEKIANDVVYIFNDGMKLAEDAIEKIEKAEAMNTNADFKEYLNLKVESLRKQLEAFDNYREAARTLREGYDPKDDAQREKVKAIFAEKDANFQKKMEEARDLSNQANILAKEKSKKTN